MGYGRGQVRLTQEQRDEVVERFWKGETTGKIAKVVGRSVNWIRQIIKEDTDYDFKKFGRSKNTLMFTPLDILYIANNPDKINDLLERKYRDYYIQRDQTDKRYSLTSPLMIESKRKLRSMVFNRDDFRCVECGSSVALEVHHLLPVNTYPEYELDDDNCVTLCYGCHLQSDKEVDISSLSKVVNLEGQVPL